MEKPICFEGLGLSCEGASTPQGRAENECCSCEWYAWFDEEYEVECECFEDLHSVLGRS